MSKKQIVQIAVITASFGGAALILYSQLFANRSAPQTVQAPPAQTWQEILPNGGSLNFKRAIDDSRFKYDQLQYPKVDPDNDIGIPESSLVAPEVE